VEPLQTKISLQESEINKLNQKVADLEMTIGIQGDVLESQQQYTRRTCLKFLKIPAPIGQTLQTFGPLKSVLGMICHDLLSIELTPQAISPCHVLGQMKDNKVSVIVRFVRYYDRETVYSAKRKLKGNPNSC